MEVTRRSVLSATLREKEMELKSFSVGFRGLEARRGCEKEFDRYREECRVLRELIQALDYEPVKAAIAEFLEKEPEPENLKVWQIKVLRGEKQTELFEDGGYTVKNSADHTERRQIPAGKENDAE